MGKGSQNKLESEPTTASSSSSSSSSSTVPVVADSKLPFYDWDEIKKHSKRDDVWIVVNNYVYDVTNFRKIHPGGSKLLNFYGGQDATEVFNAFHKEFDRVNKQSQFYKIGRVVSGEEGVRNAKDEEIKRDFEELKQKAIKRNLFEPSYFFFFVQGVQILFFHIMGYVILAYYSHSMWGILASLLFLIIAQGQASWTQHDYGHSSLFFKPRNNRYLQGLFLGIVKGGSPEWWTAMHNQHHAKPNVINKDPDVRTDPLFVLGNVQPIKRARKDAKQHKYLYNYEKQHYLFPIVAPLLFPVYFQIMTFRYVFTRKCYRDLAFMLPHYISHFVTTYLIFQSVPKTYAFFLAARLTESAWFAWVSQCNHICMDVHEDAANDTWLNLQLVGTCNLTKSPFNDWFTGHLNFQIEHHLFPTMPRHNLYKIAPDVKELCEKHGISYVVKPMGQAFLDILLSMKKSGEMWREAYEEITVSTS